MSGLRYPVRIPIEVALLLIVIGGGCQSSGNNAPSSSAARLPVVPAGFIATPSGALKVCEHIEILRSGCPRIVPRAAYRNPGGSVKLYTFFAVPARHGFPPTFSLQWHAESPNHPRLNHPPRFVHIVLYAAHGSVTRFPHAFLSGWPTDPGRIADGDVAELTRAGLALGHAQWNGRRGSLALIPPYGYGGMQGGHLVMRWCSEGTDFALGLHAWEPFTETVAELKTIVESLPPASASQGTCSGPGGG